MEAKVEWIQTRCLEKCWLERGAVVGWAGLRNVNLPERD